MPRFGQLHQLIEDVAVDQRLQVGAHQDIGRRLLGPRVQFDANGVRRTGDHLILDIGDEAQLLRLPRPLDP
ncbi:hypothetical protein FQZ97_1275940 [compost metagenome]